MYYQKPMAKFIQPQNNRILATFRPGERVKVTNLMPEPPRMDYYKRQRWEVNNYEGEVVSSTPQLLVVRKDDGFERTVYPLMDLTIFKVNVSATYF
jgi:hypothetical protein